MRSKVLLLMANGFSTSDISKGATVNHDEIQKLVHNKDTEVPQETKDKVLEFYETNKDRYKHPASSVERAGAVRLSRTLSRR